MAYAFLIARAYMDHVIARGLDVDEFASRLSFNFDIHGNFLEQVAKLRAGRRLWARLVKEQYGARNPRSPVLRMIAGGGGGGLTVEQPELNIARTAFFALASALSGTQTMALCSFDEAYTIPTEKAARITLRTMQIVAEEIGVCDTVDPLGSSWTVETLTNQMEARIVEAMGEVERGATPLDSDLRSDPGPAGSPSWPSGPPPNGWKTRAVGKEVPNPWPSRQTRQRPGRGPLLLLLHAGQLGLGSAVVDDEPEHHELAAESDLVAVLERMRSAQALDSDIGPVLAAQVLQHRPVPVHDDAGVPPRNPPGIDEDLDLRGSPDDVFARLQRVFLLVAHQGEPDHRRRRRKKRVGAGLQPHHLGHHPVAPLGDGLYVARVLGVVAEHPAQFGDGAGQGVLGHELRAPHGVDDVPLGDRLARPAGEESEDLHRPRLETHHLLAPRHPVQGRFDLPLAEQERPGYDLLWSGHPGWIIALVVMSRSIRVE